MAAAGTGGRRADPDGLRGLPAGTGTRPPQGGREIQG